MSRLQYSKQVKIYRWKARRTSTLRLKGRDVGDIAHSSPKLDQSFTVLHIQECPCQSVKSYSSCHTLNVICVSPFRNYSTGLICLWGHQEWVKAVKGSSSWWTSVMVLLLWGKLLSLHCTEPEYHLSPARTTCLHLLFLFPRFGGAYDKRTRSVLFIAGTKVLFTAWWYSYLNPL